MPVSVDRAATHLDLGELYVAHRLSLMRLATLLVDDRASAEDVVQDVFAGLASHSGSLRDPDKALAYLRKAVLKQVPIRPQAPPHRAGVCATPQC